MYIIGIVAIVIFTVVVGIVVLMLLGFLVDNFLNFFLALSAIISAIISFKVTDFLSKLLSDFDKNCSEDLGYFYGIGYIVCLGILWIIIALIFLGLGLLGLNLYERFNDNI